MKTYNKVVNKKEGKMMINKFSDFLNTEPKNNKKEDKSNETTKNFDNIDKNFSERDKKGYEDMINQYSGYSQEELMKELLKVSNEEKQKGNVDNNFFEKVSDTLSPYLSDEQKQNMKDIINKIR